MATPGSDIQAAQGAVTGNMKMRTQLEICDTVQSDGGRALVAYYEEHRSRNALPHRKQMPSRPLLGIMSHLFMLEPVDGDGTDWRFRLVGQEVVERIGVDATGLCISQAYEPDVARRNANDYRDIAMNKMVRITRGTFTGIDREYLDMEIVHVPMIGADDTTPWVLGGLFVSDDV